MAKAQVVARLLDGERLECQVVSPKGSKLVLSGSATDVEPATEGSRVLSGNRALVDNAWAHAKFTHLRVSLPTEDEQENAGKRAHAHRQIAKWIARLTDDTTAVTLEGWCSACFTKSGHAMTKLRVGQVPAHLCTNCGAPTLPCVGAGCSNFAVRSRGAVRVPRYCAEHRHEISGFEKAAHTMGSLEDYRQFLKFDKVNHSRNTKIVGFGLVGVAIGAPAALAAAPAIGGAVGTLLGGYTGAVATSHGLAVLGLGPIASGGFGMLGGTVVITAAGAALGGALGASVTNAYVRQDRSFSIEMLRGGSGTPVIVCNGFLSASGKGWGEWESIISTRYATSPVYRVHWGAKELKDLGILGGVGGVKVVAGQFMKQFAAKATKSGAMKIGPLGPVLVAADLAKNPWHVAKDRANKTGAILADLLARSDADSYVLVGHSLGARAMVVAAQGLGTKRHRPRLEALHLLGAAIGARSDWHSLTEAVDGAVYNYHSTNDPVLKWLYSVAQAGQVAAGLVGFKPTSSKLINVDVSAEVKDHSGYHHSVVLEGDEDGHA